MIVYLGVVVVMVRRQLRQVSSYQEEEEEEDRVVMTDKQGHTEVHKVEKVLNNTKEVLM